MIRLPTLYADLAASMEALRAEHGALDRSREIVVAALEDGRAHYGINTGFGVLANRRIDPARLSELLVKGFTLDDERIKAGRTIGADYFDELLSRIRDTRQSRCPAVESRRFTNREGRRGVRGASSCLIV